MASIGKINEFKIAGGNWTLYIERLEMYLKVNKVDQDMWCPTLISVMGDETYELLSNLTSPNKPSTKTYAEIVSILRDHLQPKPSIMAERYRFRQRRQKEQETVAKYISELKRLSRHCEFSTALEDNLRDQLVCGLRSDVIRQRLFAEDNLKYQGAVKLACALEAAERDAAVVESGNASGGAAPGAPATADVNAMASYTRGRGGRGRRATSRAPPPPSSDFRGRGNSVSCRACGGRDHQYEQCRYKDFTCSRCRRRGHLRRVCPERDNRDNLKGGVHNVAELDDEQGDESSSEDSRLSQAEEELYQLSLNRYKPVSMSLLVDGHNILMEIDTGSAISCISENTYNKYFKSSIIETCDTILKFYDGSKIKPLGIIRPQVKYLDRCKILKLFVIKGGTTSLLGRHWLTELKIEVPPFHKKQQMNSNHLKLSGNNNLSCLLGRYKELFAEGLGRFTGGKATLRVREGAAPVFCRPRALPYSLRARVDAELDEMLAAGVIEPVDCSDLATPLVPWLQWLVRVNDVKQLWVAQPTFLVSQAVILLSGVITLLHAFRKGGRWPYLWLGAFLHGLLSGNVWRLLPEYEHVWHSQAPVMLFGLRQPLHILFLYPALLYNAAYAVSRLKLPRYAEAFAVGLVTVLIDLPYEIVGVKFLHWSWHDTDPYVFDRHYWVPWASYFFHAAFAASFYFIFNATRRWMAPKFTQWESAGKKTELKSALLATALGLPGGMLVSGSAYHVLRHVLALHAELIFFVLVSVFFIIVLNGLLSDREKVKERLATIDYLLILQLAVHFVTYWVFVVFFSPEREWSLALHEPVGPCNEVATLKTPFGPTLYKRKFFCPVEFDEAYDFSCVGGQLPLNGASWYVVCGTPFPNRAEYISILSTILLVAAGVFYGLYRQVPVLPQKKLKTK